MTQVYNVSLFLFTWALTNFLVLFTEWQHPLWRLDMGLEPIFKHHRKHHFVWMLDLQLWIYDIHYEYQPWSGTDPVFPVEGGCQPSMGRCQHTSFPKNFVKLRKVWSVGGGHAPGALPLDPPLLMLTQTLCVNRPLGLLDLWHLSWEMAANSNSRNCSVSN